jgi:hypothetical protein
MGAIEINQRRGKHFERIGLGIAKSGETTYAAELLEQSIIYYREAKSEGDAVRVEKILTDVKTNALGTIALIRSGPALG